jgi:hypothetical protein
LIDPPSSDLPGPGDPIADDVRLYRLVPITQCDVIEGEWEFQSAAFDNATPRDPSESSDDMSVVLSDVLELLSREPAALPQETPWIEAEDHWGVAVLETSFVRGEEAQEVRRTPEPDERAHGDVRGTKNSKRRKRLKKHARWVIQPAAPSSP